MRSLISIPLRQRRENSSEDSLENSLLWQKLYAFGTHAKFSKSTLFAAVVVDAT